MSTTTRRDISIVSFQNKSNGAVVLFTDWIGDVNKAIEKEQRERFDEIVVNCESVKREVLSSKLE